MLVLNISDSVYVCCLIFHHLYLVINCVVFIVAVCNFDRGDVAHAISLRVCDTVVIQEECEGMIIIFLVT